jgi:hypothetical protein
MNLAETIYQHSLHLPEPAAQEALDFIQTLEKRYGVKVVEPLPSDLSSEQIAAYARLSNMQIHWEGRPITDRYEANAR